MTTPGHDLDRYRRLRVIPRTRDPRIRSNARDAHGNPDLLADLALRWVDVQSDALIRSSLEVTVVPRALPSACRRDLLSGNIAILYCA